MLQISVRITGTQATIDKLRRLDTSLLNFQAAMSQIGNELKSYYSGQVFASQGAVLGHPWPPLSPVTLLARGHSGKGLKFESSKQADFAGLVLSRRLQGGGGSSLNFNILDDTGTMKRSFYAKTTATSVTIGNDAPYFKYHQSSAPRHKIPYRPMLGINDDIRTIVHDIIQSDLSKKLESA